MCVGVSIWFRRLLKALSIHILCVIFSCSWRPLTFSYTQEVGISNLLPSLRTLHWAPPLLKKGSWILHYWTCYMCAEHESLFTFHVKVKGMVYAININRSHVFAVFISLALAKLSGRQLATLCDRDYPRVVANISFPHSHALYDECTKWRQSPQTRSSNSHGWVFDNFSLLCVCAIAMTRPPLPKPQRTLFVLDSTGSLQRSRSIQYICRSGCVLFCNELQSSLWLSKDLVH